MSNTVQFADSIENKTFDYEEVTYVIVEPTISDLRQYKAFVSKNAKVDSAGKVVGVSNPQELEGIVLTACIRKQNAEGKLIRIKEDDIGKFTARMAATLVEECNIRIQPPSSDKKPGEEKSEAEEDQEERGNE